MQTTCRSGCSRLCSFTPLPALGLGGGGFSTFCFEILVKHKKPTGFFKQPLTSNRVLLHLRWLLGASASGVCRFLFNSFLLDFRQREKIKRSDDDDDEDAGLQRENGGGRGVKMLSTEPINKFG